MSPGSRFYFFSGSPTMRTDFRMWVSLCCGFFSISRPCSFNVKIWRKRYFGHLTHIFATHISSLTSQIQEVQAPHSRKSLIKKCSYCLPILALSVQQRKMHMSVVLSTNRGLFKPPEISELFDLPKTSSICSTFSDLIYLVQLFRSSRLFPIVFGVLWFLPTISDHPNLTDLLQPLRLCSTFFNLVRSSPNLLTFSTSLAFILRSLPTSDLPRPLPICSNLGSPQNTWTPSNFSDFTHFLRLSQISHNISRSVLILSTSADFRRPPSIPPTS